MNRFRFSSFMLVAVEQNDGHDKDRQHDHGKRRRYRPVTVVEELLPQHFTDHQGFRAAEQFGDHELAHHR